jgi:hypothetical protein
VTHRRAIDKQNELAGLKIQRSELKRVDDFAAMSDEELRQYVCGNKESLSANG